MNTRPTPEQVAEARAVLAEFLSHLGRFPDSKRAAELAPALQHVIAATEPPTDADLLEGADVFWSANIGAFPNRPTLSQVRDLVDQAYAAGARREGRR